MIQLFSAKYRLHITRILLLVFYLQTIILPLHAAVNNNYGPMYNYAGNNRDSFNQFEKLKRTRTAQGNYYDFGAGNKITAIRKNHISSPAKVNIGGPVSPEASSFKAVGSDNLVNLFTGDFSYSIPLLDVGGYPVNLFYNSGISMEQEAGWVGLGWNINPGTVNRNMRGVPDDFNGDDKLVQTQNVKPNRTWGGEVGVNGEVLGIPKPKTNFSLGVSYNNYLGPALEIGAGVSLDIPITENIKFDKEANKNDTSKGLSASVGLNAKLNSRSGLTFSASLNANLPLKDKIDNVGVGLSTSYNSRTGIKEIDFSMGTSRNYCNNDKANKNPYSISGSIASSTISFARPSYMPTLRMPMQYSNYSGQLELGAGMFGLRGGAHAQGYYSESIVPVESQVVSKPLIGFMYSENAKNNKDAVMDFTRLNDGEVTPRTPVISAPEYAYDIFSIQGEGTGGTIRAFRGDLGFMRDNETKSKDKNISIGLDIAPPGHYGGNWNIISSPTRAGGWNDANNTLIQRLAFQTKETSGTFENIYFKNPGEATVTNSELINRIGGDNLVRFKLTGSDVNPRLESVLEQFNKNTITSKVDLPLPASNKLTQRDKRTQVTTMMTAAEAKLAGIEKSIRNYTGGFDGSNNIVYSSIDRVSDYRKAHHISEIDVLEQTGMRYVYGLPVYNIKQKDFTFSVNNIGDQTSGLVNFNTNETTVGSPLMNNKSKMDGYVMEQETPAYASSFLLTGLISPDYVDVTGDGITEDDLGTAVKFDYQESGIHKWRSPSNNSVAQSAHFNEGLKTEKKDNKANISYGEREVWYLNAIESKSMVAIFKTDIRDDAKGVLSDMDGRVNTAENANKRLTQIDLYSKAEIKAKGIANARPLKTVHFGYSYRLCVGTPDSKNGGGKLTLDSIYFTYNGQPRAKKDLYLFNYGNTSSATDNPAYANNASDKWGTYKSPDNNPATNPAYNPGGLTNAEFPYTSMNKTKNDEFAAVWCLKKVLLPSGGQMEIKYEADDYGYVQNRRACDMFNIYGLGNSTNYTQDNALYQTGASAKDNYYVYVKIPQPLQSSTSALQKQEILDKYLQGVNQLAFKLMVKMPKGDEPLTVYTQMDDYGLCANSTTKDVIYIKLHPRNNESPLTNSAIGFITENLPGQAFEGFDVEVDGVKGFLEAAGDLLKNLKNPFKDVHAQMRSDQKVRTIALDKSFVRLDDPFKMKYGGGSRVKQVVVKDNWSKMTNQFTSTYGQDYEYTTTEKINGNDAVISSGVASYEPGLGSEENPFREIISYNDKMPLAPAQYGAIEMPMLDAMYPSAGIGYSKVTVRSIHRKGTHADSAVRSDIGKQVTEFYTARDYPSYMAFTPMKTMDYHHNSFFNIFYKDLTDRKVISQGFLVETNDMHGKMKSQTAYSAADDKTPLSYSLYSYKNTGKNGLNDKVSFVDNSQGGSIVQGNMGVDMELMTDVREFNVQSNGFNGQIQTDFFSFVPWPIFGIFMLPLRTNTENRYRAVTCTKLINYHAIEDSVIVMDKGSVISTKTIAYDAETGTSIVTKTANEFNNPIYNTNYPAYWAYSGMSPAYKNAGAVYTGVTFSDGKITSTNVPSSVLESGDVVFLTNQGTAPTDACSIQNLNLDKASDSLLWVFDKNKNSSSLTDATPSFYFMDKDGKLFSRENASFKILRSGKRNMLGANAGGTVSMTSPIVANRLTIDNNSKVVNATAIEYKEKWQTENELFKRYSLACPMEVLDCNGYLEKNINPYVKGLLGTFRTNQSKVFYDARKEINPSTSTAISKNGYLDNFKLYWDFNASNNLVPDVNNSSWVWTNQITRFNSKGLELESDNALKIFSSAQYGFNNSLAIAVSNNAKYAESANAGFEDAAYSGVINNNTAPQCTTPYFDLSGLSGSAIISSETSGINAHTGKYSLKINASTSPSKQIPVTDNTVQNNNFPILPIPTITTNLNNPGGVVSVLAVGPTVDQAAFASIDNSGEIYVSQRPYIECFTQEYDPINHYSATGYSASRYFSIQTTHYIKVEPCKEGVHHFGLVYVTGSGLDTLQSITVCKVVDPIVECANGPVGGGNNFNGHPSNCNPISPITGSTTDFNLDRGLYKIVCVISSGGTKNCQAPQFSASGSGHSVTFYGCSTSSSGFGGNSGDSSSFNAVPGACTENGYGTDAGYGYFKKSMRILVSNVATPTTYLQSYASTCSSLTCSFDAPIPGDENMLNSTFKIPANKKMLFSAWVKQTCTVPCTLTTYSNSKVTLDFGSGTPVTLLPAGAIIEGWQKIEGEFTPPPGTTTMSLGFINTSGQPIYFDDIRFQPFNANMKTYAYDGRTLKLSAEMDENNYATFYEYDEEGQLVRVKKETAQGIKTINETRSAKQQGITDLQ